MGESVLVTGGTGFVGSNLVPVLSDAGFEVDILAHSERAADDDFSGVEVHVGDVTEPKTLPSFADYDRVVHLAGVVSVQGSVDDPVKTVKVNTNGTQHVLEQAREGQVDDVVYLSSGAVYGNPDYLPIDEAQPTECLHPYASSKLAGENIAESYANSYDMSVVTLRGFTLYGPGQKTDNLVPTVIEQIESGSETVSLGSLEPTRDFTYIDDLTSAVLKILDENPGPYEVYNVGSGHETSVKEIVNEIIERSGRDVSIESENASRASDIEIDRMVADVSKLRQLGWKPKYDIGRGVEETLKGYKNDND